ncbi:MAG: glycosyltransferase family 2 protein [Candidatus Omnitrophota bacterium]|jgi:glycosyltransferase involved in cell wall biosynthesis
MKKIPLSVVVMARNEEKNIAECLESVVDWVDEIVVVDDYSSDKTLEIAKKYTDKIYQRKWDMEGASRNFAYSKAGNDYVLSLDCDERVTPELRKEIIGIFDKAPEFNGYNIPHRNFLGNYWIKHGGWYPNAKLKMFRKDKFRYEESEFHPRAFMEGKTFTLNKDILHYNYPDFHSLFAKVNHQTDFEAKKWIRDGRKMSLRICFIKIFSRFMKFYFVKKGYKDGFIGFFLAIYSGIYQFYTYCKYWEIKNNLKEGRV